MNSEGHLLGTDVSKRPPLNLPGRPSAAPEPSRHLSAGSRPLTPRKLFEYMWPELFLENYTPPEAQLAAKLYRDFCCVFQPAGDEFVRCQGALRTCWDHEQVLSQGDPRGALLAQRLILNVKYESYFEP